MPEFINRPPRIQPELPSGEIDIPQPPVPSNTSSQQLLVTVAIPLITILGYVLVSGSGGRGSVLFVLPMALSVMATSVLAVVQWLQERRNDRERREAYARTLTEMRRQMMIFHDQQRAFYIYNNPDMDTIMAMVSGGEGADESRLWERRVDDNDFGAVRLGMGSMPSTVIYKIDAQDVTAPQMPEAQRLAEDSRIVHNIPITITLRPRLGEDDPSALDDKGTALGIKIPSVGRYAIGIAGADIERTSDFVRAMLVSYTAFHSPNDTRLYVIGAADRAKDWAWARWLPHCNTSRNEAGKGDLLAFEPRKTRRMWDMLQNELQRRALRAEEEDAGDVTLPFLLVVVDALSQAADSPLHSLSTEAAVALLLTRGAQLGAAVIFVVPEREQIPSECRAVIEMKVVDDKPIFRYAEIGLNSMRYDGVADVISERDAEIHYARKLASKMVRATFGADVATSVNLLELFSILYGKNYDRPNAFPILQWWRESRKPEKAEWLSVPIGLMAGNKVRSLTYAADVDGVHGMIAGTTGSGKSELLITIVVGLAMRYDPSVVNFVLADYKGGTAFDPFKPLPHAVDVVSSLSGLAGARTFTATKAEMNRRSKMLADTNTKHIVHYRQKNLHQTREPFPFLFIIVDEFAEMVKENPEFKGYLDSITRLGRALGVSLILATQRPAGVVTDQMRSNIKWRICLRVETPEDSRELLKRTDAAFLPNNIPGRGYLQVGNENVELLQLARAGAPFTGDQETAEPAVIWLSRAAGTSAVDPAAVARAAAAEVPTISDLLIARMAQLAAENDDVVPQKKPWPDPLPVKLALDMERLPGDIKPNPNLPLNGAIIEWMEEEEPDWRNPIDWRERAMRARIGLIDDPANARQLPLTIDFNRGHVAVFGGSGWGKTFLLRTLITSLAATHSPRELHIYILDFGGKGLDVVRDLPHVASYALPSQDERVTAIMRRIQDELEQRKALLSQMRTDSIAEYNVAHPEKPVPAMLVVVDNFMELRESYEHLLPELTTYVRDGRANGVYFIFTSQQPSAIPNKMFNMITERMTFRLPDVSEYQGVVGRVSSQLPEIGGRGFIQYDGNALEMQVALPLSLTVEDEQAGLDNTKKLAILVERMNKAWGDRPRPQSVDLVKALSLIELFELLDKREYKSVLDFPILEWWRESRKASRAEWIKAPIGLVTGNKVRSIVFDQNVDGVHGMVAGTTGSGKSELLLTLVAGIAMRYDPSVVNFILADYKGGSAFTPVEALPHAVDIVTNLQGMAGARTFTAMRAEMNRRSALLAATSTKHIVEYRQRNLHETREPFPFLFVIVDEFAEMVKENPEFKGNLDSITRLGRALGLFLILATQRPAGVVTDQMRSNMKWRVCLRVETGADSRELLKREDAAYLPNTVPGRGYIQVGNDNIELMQVARAGGPYTGALPDYLKDKYSGDVPALTDVLSHMMRHLLQTNPDVLEQKKPYPDPLPRLLTLDQRRLEKDFEDNPLMPLSRAMVDWSAGRGNWSGIDWARSGMRAVVGLIDDPAHAQQLQLVLNFNRGHVVAVGASGTGKTVLLRTVAMSLAATHSPKELHIYMMDFGGKGLDVLLDLPHVACSIYPSEDDRVSALLRRLSDELEQRKALLSQARAEDLAIFNTQYPDKAMPAILVMIDNFAEFRENYENLLPELTAIVRDARANGIHFIVTTQQVGALPSKLYNMFATRLAFKLTDATEYSLVVGRNMPNLPDIPGRGFVPVENEPLEMQVAQPITVTEAEAKQGLDVLKKLSRIVAIMKETWGERPVPQSVDLVRQLSLVQLFELLDKREYKSVMDFPILDWWRESRKPERAEWLKAPVGLVTGNKVRSLIFDQQIDGVHGMVAGTTGSGKSELLLTIVAGLAMRYDPSVVNFILADYKGGSAFDPFKGLPHAVDIVTNLQGLAGARTFTAMKAEMNRRSALLAVTQTKHIVDYRKRNLHVRREPFPFLFIIVDEFAEMVKENPEFKGSLDSITRLGRALGVCLILATQRPAGVVTDQMRSNIKWRICLRVETGDDSKELLKRADAAFLPNNIPGRAFLQVGNDNLELMQVARAGGPYDGPLPDFLAHLREDKDTANEIFLSNVLTAIMKRLAEENPDVKPQPKPYPDPLPLRLTLDQTSLEGERKPNPLLPLSPAMIEWRDGRGAWRGINWKTEAMRANIGLVDNPLEASQMALQLDLTKGHVVVIGASGMGKTFMLRTLIMALAATHSPAELNVYIMDLGGKGLSVLNELPHVSAPTINSGEDERIQRLLRRAASEIERRRDILSKARADTLFDYNAANPDRVIPAMLIVIDNFAEFRENYEPLLPDLISVIRDGRANGVHFVVTADSSGVFTNKLFNLFTERLALKLNDAADYMNIIGRVQGVPQDPGRGFVLRNKQALEMQIAVPVTLTEEDTEVRKLDDTKKLAQLVEQMARTWAGRPRPSGIDILRKVIPLNTILPAHPRSGVIETILGIEDTNLEPAAFDLQARGPHFVIIGPPLSGKTTALRTWILATAALYDPSQVMLVLVDLRQRLFRYGGRHSKHTLAELPHVVATVSTPEEMAQVIANLRVEFETPEEKRQGHPRREVFFIADNYDDFGSAFGRGTILSDLAVMANKYGPDGFHAVLCGSSSIMRGQDDFLRRALESRFALGLDSGESANSLGARLRTSTEEFPPGRGYIVRSNRAILMQVATPQGDADATMEEALDRWVEHICAKHKTRAQWLADLVPELRQEATLQPVAATLAAVAANLAITADELARRAAQAPDVDLKKLEQERAASDTAVVSAQKSIEELEKELQAAATVAPKPTPVKLSQEEIDRRKAEAEARKRAAATSGNGGGDGAQGTPAAPEAAAEPRSGD
ncbi:MAG: FtsK/SpoIIIE domain-containing protein [Anaerolineae bacterium]|nr:FtsK/SpoIIIE domain-containing protein [Anaerolineae bacterium]